LHAPASSKADGIPLRKSDTATSTTTDGRWGMGGGDGSTSPQIVVRQQHHVHYDKLECGPMPNVMAALQNIGGALCSMPQSLADVHY